VLNIDGWSADTGTLIPVPRRNDLESGGLGVLVATGPTFGERLKDLRERAGLNQPALADKAGLTKQAINKLEKGESEPSWITVRRLARALGVSVLEFDVGDLPGEEDGEEDQPPPPPPKKKPKKK
jgi:DNA-binding XRE family transcriptional regulator